MAALWRVFALFPAQFYLAAPGVVVKLALTFLPPGLDGISF
jgi:hypothetical protein